MNEKQDKSNLEKALESMPQYKRGSLVLFEKGKQLELNMGDIDFPDIYCVLRQTEQAYEQLDASGIDVSAPLTEKRFQIAELVCDYLNASIVDMQNNIRKRNKDYNGIPTIREDLIECAGKLDMYVRKLYPESFEKKNKYTPAFLDPD